MKKLLATSLLLAGMSLSAQNLVLNPSFENVNTNCSGFTGAGYGNLNNWYNPDPTDSCSTPDWFATCLSSFFPTHAPNSQMGNQAPRTGAAYAGFISKDNSQSGYREYVQGQLSSALVAGQTYCVTFYISLADNSMSTVNRLGMYLSSTRKQFTWNNCNSPAPLNATPQLQAPTATQMNDATNWVQYQWNYVASGGELYFTIGNFFTDAQTTSGSHAGSFTTPFAYYFIDDVSITPGVCQSCALQGNIASTNVNCHGSATGSATVTVTGGSGSQTYQWLPSGGTGASASNLAAGTYTVNITDGGCSASQTVTITEPTAVSSSITNTVAATCGQSNGSATAAGSGGTGPYTYSWNTGVNGPTLPNIGSGNYTVTVTDSKGCTSTAIASITSTNGPTATASITQTVSCSGGSDAAVQVTASGGTPSYTVNWSNGMTGDSITNLSAGQLTYTVTDAAGCSTGGSVNINMAPDILVNTTTTPSNCSGTTGTGSVTATGGAGGFTFTWMPGNLAGAYQTNLAPGTYTVTIQDNNKCTRTTTVVINCTMGINQHLNNTTALIVHPNPANNQVTISALETPQSIQMYNVAGELIFQTVPVAMETQIDLRSVAAGVYFIKVELANKTTQHIKLLKQ